MFLNPFTHILLGLVGERSHPPVRNVGDHHASARTSLSSRPATFGLWCWVASRKGPDDSRRRFLSTTLKNSPPKTPDKHLA